MRMYQYAGKRIFDAGVSLVCLIILSPIFFVIAVLIKCDSPGPVFFVQDRIGRGGKIFRVFKFRTMHVDKTEESRLFTPGNTDRVTVIGRFLRNAKLDELPQLINVLQGNMSFVGPRPEVPKYRNAHSGKFKQVLSLKPGITDWASIKYRNEENILSQSANPESVYEKEILPDKLSMALEYMGNVSFINDVKILVMTVVKVFG